MRKLKIAKELKSKQESQHLYKNEETVEYKHGGRREGSGRKVIGETHKVSISFPYGDWERFDRLRGEQSRSASGCEGSPRSAVFEAHGKKQRRPFLAAAFREFILAAILVFVPTAVDAVYESAMMTLNLKFTNPSRSE